jgi:hypothetical protein
LEEEIFSEKYKLNATIFFSVSTDLSFQISTLSIEKEIKAWYLVFPF